MEHFNCFPSFPGGSRVCSLSAPLREARGGDGSVVVGERHVEHITSGIQQHATFDV